MIEKLIKYWKKKTSATNTQQAYWHAENSYEIVRGPIEKIASAANAATLFKKTRQGGVALYLVGEDNDDFQCAVTLCKEILNNYSQIKKGKKQGLVRKGLQEHEKRARDKRRDVAKKKKVNKKYQVYLDV